MLLGGLLGFGMPGLDAGLPAERAWLLALVRGGAMTFDIRKTSIAAQVNVRPLAERFGSNKGRRTMAESMSMRRRKKTPTTKSHK